MWIQLLFKSQITWREQIGPNCRKLRWITSDLEMLSLNSEMLQKKLWRSLQEGKMPQLLQGMFVFLWLRQQWFYKPSPCFSILAGLSFVHGILHLDDHNEWNPAFVLLASLPVFLCDSLHSEDETRPLSCCPGEQRAVCLTILWAVVICVLGLIGMILSRNRDLKEICTRKEICVANYLFGVCTSLPNTPFLFQSWRTMKTISPTPAQMENVYTTIMVAKKNVSNSVL